MIKHEANSCPIVEHELIKKNGSVNAAHNSCVSCSLDYFNHNLCLTVVVFGSHSLQENEIQPGSRILTRN